MKKRILGFILAAVFVSAPVWANYIGDLMKAGIDVSSNTVKIPQKSLKVGANTATPSLTLDQGDAYVQGTLEVDGAVRLDNASLTLRGVAYTLPAADGAAGAGLTTNGSGVLSWAAGAAGNTLDGAYDQGGAGVGRAITVDSGAITMTNAAADNNSVLQISKSPVGAQSGDAVSITMSATATGDALQFINSGSGNDIAGSGNTWTITKAGVGTFTDLSTSTLTTTGATTLGNGTTTVAVNSNSWDITTAGAISGVTTLSMSDNLSLANGKAIRGTAVSGEAIKIQVYDNDTGPAYVDAITLTNGNAPAIAIGSNNETVAVNSSDWDISATGDMTGIGAITADGLITGTLGIVTSGAASTINHNSNFNLGLNTGTSTGTLTLGNATGPAVVTGVGTWTINHDAAAMTTGIGTGTTTGQITIGGTGAQTINVGNGAAAKTVNVGSTNTTSSTGINSGSGGVNINVSNNQPTNIGSGTTTGTITIGGAGAQTLDIGNGAAAKTVNLGSSNTTSTTTLLSGSGGVLVNKDNSQPVEVGTGTSTGAVTIGGTAAQTIAVGTGAAAKTVSLGSTNTTSTTTINAGSGGIVINGNITNDGTDTITGFLRTVVDDADGEAALGVSESGSVQTNAGAGGAAAWVLPAAAPGLEFTFVVMAAQELRVTPAAGDAINIAGVQGDAAEYWYANAVGGSLTLIAVDTNNWVAKSYTGTWSQQTP